MPTYDIRPFRPGEEPAIVDTFNLVFGEGREDFVPRTLAEWKWINTENPSGVRVWVAMCEDTVAACYATQPHRVIWEGREAILSQVVDSMVHPEHRRGLKRPGLFAETGRRMLEATCGQDRDIAIYGWPVPGAWRIGHAFLGYRMVRMQSVLTRPPGSGPSELPVRVDSVGEFDASVLELYERCRSAWGLSTVRDAEFLNWRFRDCPSRQYEILAHRNGGRWNGYAVIVRGDFPTPGSLVVVDWLVPDPAGDDDATGVELMEALLARARADGIQQIYMYLPEWSTWFERLQEHGWVVGATDYLTAYVSFHPRLDAAYLRDRWWYTFADVDLF